MTPQKLKFTLLALIGGLTLTGCGSSGPSSAPMAPPMQQTQNAPPVGEMGSGGMNPGGVNPAGADVYNWRDVPQGQRVPVIRATFDQGGYQIFTNQGTIVVPFENQNLYVMRFGRTNNQQFFAVENGAPTLYLQPGGSLENAAAQGARWYPIPNDFAYSQPMYVGLAPSWGAYSSMGWYPGMAYYGGMWGYRPGLTMSWMPGFSVHIGGGIYPRFASYTNYYTSRGGYINNRVVYRNYNTASRGTGSFGNGSSGSRRTSGSYSGGSTRTGGGTGSFGSGRTYGYKGGTGFGSGQRSGGTGSFGSGGSRSYGGSSGRTYGGSGGSGSFGGSRGYSTTPRSGGSFGGSRSYGGGGGSFGGGRSYGGSRSSGGSSFGGGRRR